MSWMMPPRYSVSSVVSGRPRRWPSRRADSPTRWVCRSVNESFASTAVASEKMTCSAPSSVLYSSFRRSAERTRAISSAPSTGLAMKSSAPASSAMTRCVVWLSPVIITTGRRRPRGIALMRLHTSYPSIRGIRTSSRTRSGGLASISASALGPSSASITSQSMVARNRRINSRFAALSSTTSTTGISSTTLSEPEGPAHAPPGCRPPASTTWGVPPRPSGDRAPGAPQVGPGPPARRERPPGLPVGPAKGPAGLEDLRVQRMAACLPVGGTGLVEPVECDGKLRVSGRVVVLRRGDPAEPHVGLSGVGVLAKPFGQLDGRPGVRGRGLVARPLQLQLAEGHEHVGPACFQPDLFELAERSFRVAHRRGEVALLEDQQSEVVLAECDQHAVLQRLVDRHGLARIVPSLAEMTQLLIGEAEVAVHVGEPPKVGEVRPDGDRLLVGIDGSLVLVARDENMPKHGQEPGLGRRWNGVEGAAAPECLRGEIDRDRVVHDTSGRGLPAEALRRHQDIACLLEVSPRRRCLAARPDALAQPDQRGAHQDADVCSGPPIRAPGHERLGRIHLGGVFSHLDQALDLGQAGLVAGRGVTEKVLQGLVRPGGDQLECLHRGPCLARFDEVDRGPADVALSDLAQAHAGLHAGLLDRACAHVDAPSPPSAPAGFGLLRWKLSGSLWHLASLTQPALT